MPCVHRWIHGRSLRTALLFCAALLLAAGLQPALGGEVLLARARVIRIMPLGDSITAGIRAGGTQVTDGGYRGALASLLAKDGYHATFVGTRSDYSNAIADRAHEGWPGYVLRSYPSSPGPGQLYGPLLRSVLRSDAPDVVLLMAGTNDLLRLQRGEAGYTLTNILASMNLVIDEIFYERPDVHVIVAPVVASPRVDACMLARFAGEQACGPVEGPNLKTLVASYAARGFHITFARGMFAAVPRNTRSFPDGIHPADAGYAAIADVWLAAIRAITALPDFGTTQTSLR
jgi:lysophospholipase L1-like esterase